MADTSASVDGCVAMITGAGQGIGRAYALSFAEAGPMREAGCGRIINISSSTVPQGIPGFTNYVTSKSALIGMTRCMARELGDANIAVNAVLPGMIETETETEIEIENAGRNDAGRAAIISHQSLKRQQEPMDMVGTVLFLSSPTSGFMTGQSLCVDGGAAFI